MADKTNGSYAKKKKKSKGKVVLSKQNRNKQQVQQVTVNVGVGRRSSNKQQKQQAQPQAAKAPNINYELFRTINSIATTQQQMQKKAETPKDTSPALFQNTPERNRLPPPPPQPSSSASSFVTNLIDKSNLFNKINIPDENMKKPSSPSAFDKILFTPKQALKQDVVEDNVKLDDPLPEQKPKIKPRPTTPAPPPPTNVRFTLKGLPRRRTREEKVAYNDYIENVVGNKPANERTKEESKAYDEYLNSLGKPRADEIGQQSIEPFLRPTSRKPKKIQPVDFDTVDEDEINRIRKEDDEDDELFFSPLRQKPT
jgi:hypothetical protein